MFKWLFSSTSTIKTRSSSLVTQIRSGRRLLFIMEHSFPPKRTSSMADGGNMPILRSWSRIQCSVRCGTSVSHCAHIVIPWRRRTLLSIVDVQIWQKLRAPIGAHCLQCAFSLLCSQNAEPPHCLQCAFRLLCSQNAEPSHCLQSAFRLLCSQNAEPLHCLQSAFRLLCSQNDEPLHCLQYAFRLSCIQNDEPSHFLHSAFRLLCSQNAEPPHCPHAPFRLLCVQNICGLHARHCCLNLPCGHFLQITGLILWDGSVLGAI